ncbi:MAG: TonB family protein [Gemmatimonadota bacterium]
MCKLQFTLAVMAGISLAPGLVGSLGAQQDRPPRIENASHVQRLMLSEYPLEMRQAGVAGTVMLELYVREDGRPRDIRVVEPLAALSLQAVALEIAAAMRFDPARRDGEKVEQLVRFPIQFTTSCGTAPETVRRGDQGKAAEGLDLKAIDALAESPTSTGMLLVSIDTLGAPEEVEIIDSTGSAEADTFLVRLTLDSRFDPIRWRGNRVPGRFRTLAHPTLAPNMPRPEDSARCRTRTPLRLINRGRMVAGFRTIARFASQIGARDTREAAAQLYVGADGRVEKVHMVRSTCWAELDERLQAEYRRAEFEPHQCDGRPIPGWVRLPVHLDLD